MRSLAATLLIVFVSVGQGNGSLRSKVGSPSPPLQAFIDHRSPRKSESLQGKQYADHTNYDSLREKQFALKQNYSDELEPHRYSIQHNNDKKLSTVDDTDKSDEGNHPIDRMLSASIEDEDTNGQRMPKCNISDADTAGRLTSPLCILKRNSSANELDYANINGAKRKGLMKLLREDVTPKYDRTGYEIMKERDFLNLTYILEEDYDSVNKTTLAEEPDEETTDDNECLQLLEEDFMRSQEMASCTSELLTRLGVTSYAMISQCGTEQVAKKVLKDSQRVAGIPSCVFSSLLTLTAPVMVSPDRALCFTNREWTIVLLGSSKWAAQLITTSKKLGLYDSRVHWVVLVSDAKTVSPTLPAFLLTHRITWLRWSLRFQGWVVLVSVPTKNGVTAREAGKWQKGQQIFRPNQHRSLKPPYITNFFRAPLRVVSRRDTDLSKVFNTVGRCYYTPNGRTWCTGYVGEMMMILVENLNLTVINKMVRSCGVANSNGTRVSIIASDEADIALGTCSITADRITMVDFTEFFYSIRATICTAAPDVVQSTFLIFEVLSWETWLCVGAYMGIVSLTLWGVTLVLKSLVHQRKSTFASAVVLITKAFLYQAHAHQPTSLSGRAVVAVSWVIIITMAGIYSGNLTAWLSLPRYERPVDSLADLAERLDLKPVVRRNDPNHQMFINQTEGVLGQVAKRLVLVDTTSNLAKDIVHGETAYMNSDRSHIAKATILNREEGILGFAPCRIHLASQDIRQDYLGLMINKNSWFKEQMNERIQWLRSYGIVDHLYRQFNPPGCQVSRSGDRTTGSSKSLSLAQLQGVCWVWLAGIFMASVSFLFEVLIPHKTKTATLPGFT